MVVAMLRGVRLLHTSDWHLGRTFHGVDLLADQRRALSDLAALVAEEAADAVIVAGDVYDRSVDMLISRLRKKLGDDSRSPRFIKTIWGVGYQFVGAADG